MTNLPQRRLLNLSLNNGNYSATIFLKRLKVIPLTLALILILNFVLVHAGSTFRPSSLESWEHTLSSQYQGSEDDFTTIYGLDLPLFLNFWPFISQRSLREKIAQKDPKIARYAPYILPTLIKLYQVGDIAEKEDLLKLIVLGSLKRESRGHFFSQSLPLELKQKMTQIEAILSAQKMSASQKALLAQVASKRNKAYILFCETQFFRYFKRVLFFDFGSLKGDLNQKVAPLVFQKLKVSLSFLVWPFITVFLCSQLIGLWMAYRESALEDRFLTLFFVLLYGAPIYLVGPFLIEKVALPLHLPIHGPHFKKLSHFVLPFITLVYGAFALYSRVYKSLFNQLLAKEYLLSLKAKGLSQARLLFVHTLRQALVTTLPLSLGAFGYFMGGLIIVENIFEMEGVGRLYFNAIINQDYHVIIFVTLLISVLTQILYLVADVMLCLLDPRISHSHDQRVFERA